MIANAYVITFYDMLLTDRELIVWLLINHLRQAEMQNIWKLNNILEMVNSLCNTESSDSR